MSLILSNEDVEKVLSMKLCLEALEEAYREMGAGRAASSPRCDIVGPVSRNGTSNAHYGLKSMGGVVPKAGTGAIRINSDLIHWPTVDGVTRRVKIPAAMNKYYVGLILLFSCETGEPLALFPDGFLQRMRVGGASGLGAKHLARKDAQTVGLIGSGWQAGSQLMALCEVRAIQKIKVYSPNTEHRRQFAAEMTEILGVEVVPVERAEEAVRGSDIVHAATNAIEPIIFGRWLEEGTHTGCIRHCELDAELYNRAEVILLHSNKQIGVIHSVHSEKTEEFPELQKGWEHPQQDQIKVRWETLPDIGDLLVGRAKGRQNDRQITCFNNNIGMGLQFAAVGSRVYQEARKHGLGHEIPTEWLTQTVHP